MKHHLALLFTGSLTLGVSTAVLADEIDMAKITCGEVIAMPEGATLTVASWMSGYFNSKANNTVLDLGIMMHNGDVVSDFCQKNPSTPVMKAIKELMPN